MGKGKKTKDKKTTSRTEQESTDKEQMFGDHHYKTTISDGKDTVEGVGNTSEGAEEVASGKWDKRHK